MDETTLLLRKPEAARRLGVSPSTIDRLRANGELAWVAIGGQVRFRPEALLEYVARAERPARSEPAEPIPRARRALSSTEAARGPRQQRGEAQADFDELFPLSEPSQAALEAAR